VRLHCNRFKEYIQVVTKPSNHYLDPMANSKFSSSLHFSDQFIESAGAVLFSSSSSSDETVYSTELPETWANINTTHTGRQTVKPKICLLHYKRKNEVLLPKGRRSLQEESRSAEALREVEEETGFPCSLLPIKLATRAPPASEPHAKDKTRVFEGVTREPFAVQQRVLDNALKIIWWYVAVVDKTRERSQGECAFDVIWVEADEDGFSKLTFETDQRIARQATELVQKSGYF
jgi:8-oxo-dGTP pyrophosphatase MutT (NUDIX family)